MLQIEFTNGSSGTYLTGFSYDPNTGRLNEISFEPDDQGRDIDYTYNDDGLVTLAEHSRGGSAQQVRYGKFRDRLRITRKD
jgi:hypothetical protein